MKISVRPSVFETNSSSTHCLVIVSKTEWEKFKNGQLLFDNYNDELVPNTISRTNGADEGQLYTFDQFFSELEYETFEYSHTTDSGDEIIAFGYHGYDG